MGKSAAQKNQKVGHFGRRNSCVSMPCAGLNEKLRVSWMRMDQESSNSRRRFLSAGAWAIPVVGIGVAAPMASASTLPAVAVQHVSTHLNGEGRDIRLNDGKNRNLNSTAPQSLALASFEVVDTNGDPVSAATVVVSGDSLRDGEGNYMVAVWPGNAQGSGGFGESPIQRIATVNTDAAGRFSVKLATATFSLVDCVGVSVPPKNGVLTVDVNAPGVESRTATFTYQVFDGSTPLNGIVNCRAS